MDQMAYCLWVSDSSLVLGFFILLIGYPLMLTMMSEANAQKTPVILSEA
jgi:hypothetical protein